MIRIDLKQVFGFATSIFAAFLFDTLKTPVCENWVRRYKDTNTDQAIVALVMQQAGAYLTKNCR